MTIQHWVFPPFLVVFLLFCPLVSFMQTLKVASLNINGGRNAHKRALVSEALGQKDVGVIFYFTRNTQRCHK